MTPPLDAAPPLSEDWGLTMRRWAPALAACAVLVGALTALPACAGSPPSAADLWAGPARSNVRDAHVAVVVDGGDATSTGSGLVVFRPRLAVSLHLESTSGGLPVGLEVLQVAGTTYQRSRSNQRWSRSTKAPPDPSWDDAGDPRLLGEERVQGSPAWHLRGSRGGSPVDMWVRASDGYPLRVVARGPTGSTFTFTFDRFNSGLRLQAPPLGDLQPAARALTGGVGDALTLSGARITLLDADTDAGPGESGILPRPGDRFVVLEVQVDDVGSEALSTFLDWRLQDSSGTEWAQAVPVQQPPLVGDELQPGESARGFLTYELGEAAQGLSLTVRVNDDTATFALG